MALEYSHPDHPEAYMRIARIETHRALDGTVTHLAAWQAWHNAARRQEGAGCIDNAVSEVPSADWAEAYQALKTIFDGAIDV